MTQARGFPRSFWRQPMMSATRASTAAPTTRPVRVASRLVARSMLSWASPATVVAPCGKALVARMTATTTPVMRPMTKPQP